MSAELASDKTYSVRDWTTGQPLDLPKNGISPPKDKSLWLWTCLDNGSEDDEKLYWVIFASAQQLSAIPARFVRFNLRIGDFDGRISD